MKFANLFIGVSLFAGAVATPAVAASISNPTVGGAADVILYNVEGNNTKADSDASLAEILIGNALKPGGNVELFATSEQPGADFSQRTTVSGMLNGKSITLSSLTVNDWDAFGQAWFSEFVTHAFNKQGQGMVAAVGTNAAYKKFSSMGFREIFSDPNISYVNQNDNNGVVNIGLAGHLNAHQRITSLLPSVTPYLNNSISASEIVKVNYDGGPAQYLWSFTPTESGLSESTDSSSHSGNYEVSFQGSSTEAVPEPLTILGTVAAAGIGVVMKQRRQTAS